MSFELLEKTCKLMDKYPSLSFEDAFKWSCSIEYKRTQAAIKRIEKKLKTLSKQTRGKRGKT